MIKFIEEKEEPESVIFSNVEEDQFFLNEDKYFCQKKDHDSYCMIADSKGKPMCSVINRVKENTKIKKIFPLVAKIEWD